MDDGITRAALVALDLISLERREVLRARELIASRTGIPASNVMIACSHTHQGPVTRRFGAAPRHEAYVEVVPRRIADTVSSAAGTLHEVGWGFALGREGTVGGYRRLRLADGRVRNAWNLPPDAGNPEPLGEIDPDLPVIALGSAENLQAVLVNFACHATCRGDGRWSANYPGALAANLGPALGIDPQRVLYTAGAAGNTNPKIPDAGECGQILSAAIMQAWPSMTWQSEGRLTVRERAITLPARQPDRFPFQLVNDVWNNRGNELQFARSLKFYADNYVALLERGPVPDETALQVLALGDVALVAIPGEFFVELGREIKRQSPFARTLIVTLANDSLGYIPHRAAFEQGGYETIFASQSHLVPEAGEMIVEAAVDLLREVAGEHASSGR